MTTSKETTPAVFYVRESARSRHVVIGAGNKSPVGRRIRAAKEETPHSEIRTNQAGMIVALNMAGALNRFCRIIDGEKLPKRKLKK